MINIHFSIHHILSKILSRIFSKTLFFKTNKNGAVFSQSGQTRVGVVIRDHEGRVVAALSKQVQQLQGPLEVEAKAIEVGVSFAWDVGIREVILECDSKIISDALLGLCTSPLIISNILARYIINSRILE